MLKAKRNTQSNKYDQADPSNTEFQYQLIDGDVYQQSILKYMHKMKIINDEQTEDMRKNVTKKLNHAFKTYNNSNEFKYVQNMCLKFNNFNPAREKARKIMASLKETMIKLVRCGMKITDCYIFKKVQTEPFCREGSAEFLNAVKKNDIKTAE